MYDPVAAVMMGPDPSSTDPYHTDDYNKFAYVWNNPLKYTDPTGLNVDWFRRRLADGTSEVKYFPEKSSIVVENGYVYENVGEEAYYRSEKGNVYGDEDGNWYLTGYNGSEITTITQDGGKPRDPVRRLDFEDDFVQPESDLPNQSFEEFRKVVQAYDGMFNFVSGYGVTVAYLAPEVMGGMGATAPLKLLRTASAANKVNKGIQYTKSSLSLGQKMHKGYRAGEVLKNVRIKEFVLPSGRRIDFIDLEKRIIYELKPNNPRAIKEGYKQLSIYLQEIESIYGKGWKTVLDTY